MPLPQAQLARGAQWLKANTAWPRKCPHLEDFHSVLPHRTLVLPPRYPHGRSPAEVSPTALGSLIS